MPVEDDGHNRLAALLDHSHFECDGDHGRLACPLLEDDAAAGATRPERTAVARRHAVAAVRAAALALYVTSVAVPTTARLPDSRSRRGRNEARKRSPARPRSA